MALSNSQRRLGYYHVVYNVKSKKFWIPRPNGGENYVELDLHLDGPGEEVDLDGYATEEWVNSQGFLTECPVNLDGYATEEWVNEQGFLTEVPDVEEGFSGDYNDLTNKPDVYTKAEADARFVNVNIQNLVELGEDPDEDFFELKTQIAQNITKVRS